MVGIVLFCLTFVAVASVVKFGLFYGLAIVAALYCLMPFHPKTFRDRR